jgi:Protein of unknown function (DUF1549)/Protein of unknown function (DUF1553)/Bacterial Ig-like domain (group 2)
MHAVYNRRRILTFLLVALLAGLGLNWDHASAGEVAAAANPSSGEITLLPRASLLSGRRATQQMIATSRAADGSVQDATRSVEWFSHDPSVAVVSSKGRVTPRGNGTAKIVARLGSQEVEATVKVEGMEHPAPVSFRRDVIPAFSQAGCNMGACHGTPTGKGGFRLSLRGYLPDQDFTILSRESGGRRINPMAAETSLLLRKPLGEVPHEGGLRLVRGSKTYEFLHDWIKEGAKDDPGATPAVRLEILPEPRVLIAPAATQQLMVCVYDANNKPRDITPICYYDSSNPEIAEVDAEGYVRFKSRGEVAIIAHYLNLVANIRLTHLVEVPGFVQAEVPQDNVIDRAVFTKLNRMRIRPSEPCSDREFIRRVYLDVIGVLPTPGEVEHFLNSPAKTRRDQVIDSLLSRPEFYDFWSLKFADILRANGRLIESKGAYVFHRWIRTSLERDMPMNEFVRELLTAEGSAYKNPAANYYRISRDPESSVETTAQLFLGVRIQCAKCHNHPFERWTQDDYYGFAAFFSQVGRKKGNLPDDEVVYASGSGEVRQPRTGQVMKPKALGGPTFDDSPQSRDRRTRLATWLSGVDNPFFGKSLVNRVWYHVMGRGIVEPVDDFRDSNPASNDELLDGLTAEFVKNGYHLKGLVRSIVRSRIYQLSATTNTFNVDDGLYFSHALTKLLSAEVLLDAISTLTGTMTKFDGLPTGSRATQIPDGKMDNPFLKTFGRPARELACECERESESNLSQALQLIGGATVNGKLHDDNGRMAQLVKAGKKPPEITRELYLAALSREPSKTELEAATKHLSAAKDLRQAVEDLGWVLINSKEFLFRH